MKNLKLLAATFGVALFISAWFPLPAYASTAADQIREGVNTAAGKDNAAQPGDLGGTVKSIINILSILIGAIAVIMLIYGGFRYVTSGGNDTAVQAAKNTILYAIIGLVLVALAQVIVKFVLGSVPAT